MPTTVAVIVIGLALVRGVIYLFQHTKSDAISQRIDAATWGRYLACLGSGILFTNAIPHFFHGVSGEYFRAPFFQQLGRGLPEDLSNVIWGFVNIVFGYNLFALGRASSPDRWGKVAFFAGILLMGIFLSFAFSNLKA